MGKDKELFHTQAHPCAWAHRRRPKASLCQSGSRLLFMPVLALCSVWLPAAGLCAGALEIGPMKARPHLEAGAVHDDNVFIAPSNEKGDFLFRISPGVQLIYGATPPSYVSVDYTATLERFSRLTEQNADNHFVTVDGHLEFNRLTLTLKHAFQKVTGPNVEVGDRIEQTQNLTRLEGEYRINEKISVGGHYRQEIHDFDPTGLVDYQLYEAGGTFYYHAFPKTDLFGQLAYGWVTEDTGADQNYQEVNLGVRGKLTSKVSGTVKVGYQHRDFDGPADSTDTVVASVGLQVSLTERTEANFAVSRSINPSVTSAGNSYEATRLELGLSQKLWKDRVTLKVGGVYEHDDYDLPVGGLSRADDFWEASVGVVYDPTTWFQFGTHYRYSRNGSTVNSVSFARNVVGMHALLRF